MRAGTAEGLGLGADALQARNPKLVYCSIGAFGRSGPLAGQPGYDPLLQAFAGLISITGEPERPGVRIGASVIDIGTGVWAALGIVAALHERTSTGRGREVDVTLLDTALSLVAYQLTATLRTGDAPGRFGTAFPLIAPYEVFETADGALMIAAANDRLFAELCERIGLPGLAGDPRFATNPDRLANRAELLPPIREKLAARPSAEWLRILEGIPAAPVQNLFEVAQHEQIRAVGMIGEVDGVETVGVPLQIDGERVAHDAGPPTLGRHSVDVLTELGYSETEIATLVAEGVVVSSP